MLRIGGTVFLKEGHINWLSNNKFSALKTYIQVTMFRLSRLHLGTHTHKCSCIYIYIHIYVCIYMHVITINEKRDNEYERRRRGIWECMEKGNRKEK